MADKSKELAQVQSESDQIHKINLNFVSDNTKLKEDLAYCQEHLQNLLKHNAYIQE
jgi:FtsZ-binding cell division protein ZapB